jgi:UDPglucose 6-dehydrogenase
MSRYSVFGLGKLGASMAAAIASRGYEVIGVDVLPKAVAAVNEGRAPVQETDLEATIAANRERLSATLDAADAVRRSDVTFVVVPTPSDERGAFSIEYARSAFADIGRGIAAKDGYHLVVLTSTVLPGSTRHGLLPALEQASGKRAGVDFGLCYSPEFIALGSVIRDFLHPDFTLIGELDERSGDRLEDAYREILPKETPSGRMSLENAELAKVAVNTYVTTKIAFANMLAGLCERLPGGDVDAVTRALGMDSRIGAKYLKGATAYGGPCFPRDNLALSFMARALGGEAPLAETTDRMNRALTTTLVDRAVSALPPGGQVAVLGLAYKPDSHVVEAAAGMAAVEALAARGVPTRVFDPLASAAAVAPLAGVTFAASPAECLEAADAVLVMTPDAAFRSLSAEDFARTAPAARIYDCWRMLEPAVLAAGREYVAVGRGAGDEGAALRLAALWGQDG